MCGNSVSPACSVSLTHSLIDVKIREVLVQPCILELTVLVAVSQPGVEPPAALAQLDPCGGGLWSVALGPVR